MSTLPTKNSLVLAPARINLARFTELLKTKNSPAVPVASQIYAVLIEGGVDPSFALAQYRVESQYGTSGHAVVTKSWGNMLYDSGLTILAAGQYSPGNGFTYAKYTNLVDAVRDYVRYIHNYAERRNRHTVYEVSGEWLGPRNYGNDHHVEYVNIIVDDMIRYEFIPGTWYEVGDKMIYAGTTQSNGRLTKKYPVPNGTELFRGTNGDILKKASFLDANGNPRTALCWFLGLVNNSTQWGMILVKTSSADSGGTLCYIKNIDKSKIINV